MHQLACARVEPQRVEQQALLHLPAVHVLARELRRHRRVEGVGPVGRLVPAEHLRHLAVRTRLVHRRRVDPVARQHPAGLVQHLQARLPARRHVQQYPLQRQLRQPRLQRVAVHVGGNAQPLEALAAHLDGRHVELPRHQLEGHPAAVRGEHLHGRIRLQPAGRSARVPRVLALRPVRDPVPVRVPQQRVRAARVLQPVGHPVPVAVDIRIRNPRVQPVRLLPVVRQPVPVPVHAHRAVRRHRPADVHVLQLVVIPRPPADPRVHELVVPALAAHRAARDQ